MSFFYLARMLKVQPQEYKILKGADIKKNIGQGARGAEIGAPCPSIEPNGSCGNKKKHHMCIVSYPSEERLEVLGEHIRSVVHAPLREAGCMIEDTFSHLVAYHIHCAY